MTKLQYMEKSQTFAQNQMLLRNKLVQENSLLLKVYSCLSYILKHYVLIIKIPFKILSLTFIYPHRVNQVFKKFIKKSSKIIKKNNFGTLAEAAQHMSISCGFRALALSYIHVCYGMHVFLCLLHKVLFYVAPYR